MTTYVDDLHHSPNGKLGRMRMSHMLADTLEELHAMADKIGVKRRWLQHVGTYKEHYDVCLSKRALAVRLGAVEITQRQCGMMVMLRRMGLPMGDPATAEERLRKARWEKINRDIAERIRAS